MQCEFTAMQDAIIQEGKLLNFHDYKFNTNLFRVVTPTKQVCLEVLIYFRKLK